MKTISLSLAFLSSLAASADVTYHQQIAPIIGQKCLGCHGARPQGAPFSLSSYADLASRVDLVEQAVVDRSMPPTAVDASGSCQSYASTSWMTDSEIAMIQDWAAQGAPEGDAATAADIPEPEGQSRLDRVDAVVGMKKPYTPPADADELRCFLTDAPVGDD
ncbi:MAG TPA: hypothetical protein VM598_00115, partial [Bdellovibrionota bacterium]|nr:hypothetical protein [Bdellovibrionota bacterium]